MNLRDFLKFYTEISSLNWIFHQNRPVTGSRVSFLENRGLIKTIKDRGNAEQTNREKKSAHLLSIMIFLFFQCFLMNVHFYQ